jgi:hypothetical protein
MKKLNLQMLHLGSALALLGGIFFTLTAFAEDWATPWGASTTSVSCGHRQAKAPSCHGGNFLHVPKGSYLYFGVSTSVNNVIDATPTELTVNRFNDGVVVIRRSLYFPSALNGRMKVTEDNRYFFLKVRVLGGSPFGSIRGEISRTPTHLTRPITH